MGLREGRNGITVGNPGDGARTPQPPTFRLSRELEAEVQAEARRIGIETGSKPRPLDLIRVLISEALAARAVRNDAMPSAHVEVGTETAAEIVGVTVGALLAMRGDGAPTYRSTPAGRRYGLASLLRWMAADLRARRGLAAEVQAELSDGLSRG